MLCKKKNNNGILINVLIAIAGIWFILKKKKGDK